MEFHAIDGYLLDGRPAKSEVIAGALRARDGGERARPFYRALESVGVRAADEALIALRLAIAGQAADDTIVRRLRGLVALAAAREPAAIDAAFAKAGGTLADLAPLRGDPAGLAAAARTAYLATFGL